ncbi:hypothetical protein MJD09_08775 [bacterium]|nr:hypothetical protein [bacterium]
MHKIRTIIVDVSLHAHGVYHVLMRDGTRLKLSRTYCTKLQERLGKPF